MEYLFVFRNGVILYCAYGPIELIFYYWSSYLLFVPYLFTYYLVFDIFWVNYRYFKFWSTGPNIFFDLLLLDSAVSLRYNYISLLLIFVFELLMFLFIFYYLSSRYVYQTPTFFIILWRLNDHDSIFWISIHGWYFYIIIVFLFLSVVFTLSIIHVLFFKLTL